MAWTGPSQTAQATASSTATATFASTPTQGDIILISIRTNYNALVTVKDGNGNSATLINSAGGVRDQRQRLPVRLDRWGEPVEVDRRDGDDGRRRQRRNFRVLGWAEQPHVHRRQRAGGVDQHRFGGHHDVGQATVGHYDGCQRPRVDHGRSVEHVRLELDIADERHGHQTVPATTSSELADAYQIETATGTYTRYFSWTTSRNALQLTTALLASGSTPVALAGESDSLSSAAATLTDSDTLAGESDAKSSAAGTLSDADTLVGESDSHSAAAASLADPDVLASESDSRSGASASLADPDVLAGESDSHSGAAAGLADPDALAGESDARSAAAGTLGDSDALTGESGARSKAAGTLSTGGPLSGTSGSESSASGALTAVPESESVLETVGCKIGPVASVGCKIGRPIYRVGCKIGKPLYRVGCKIG